MSAARVPLRTAVPRRWRRAASDVLGRRGGPEVPAGGTAIPDTFRDPVHEAAFRRDGFVVVPVLDEAARARLLDDYQRLTHHHDRSLPFAEGFHTTLYDDRHDYRVAVTEAIEAALGPGLDRVLTGHRIQFANFQVKVPGAEVLPEHIDWTFVDEERARSVTVWCATHPMDATNGSLGVRRGSHELVTFTRAVNHRFYECHSAAAAEADAAETLTLGAGEAVIFDNRLLHFSAANTSDGNRLAASCVATPCDEPVYHHWFDDEGNAHRLEVGPDFWLHYAIGEDPRSVAGCLTDEVVSGGIYA